MRPPSLSKRAHITALNDGVCAIDTEYLLPLQDASHLIVQDGRAAFVDTGANDAVPLLLDALRRQDLDAGDVDYVFLTHIHLDHAGGAGLLMQQLPNARCVVHPRGAPHMVDPERLIAGTIAVYGEDRMRAMYGDIVPIDASRVVVADDEARFEIGGERRRVVGLAPRDEVENTGDGQREFDNPEAAADCGLHCQGGFFLVVGAQDSAGF